MIKQVIFDFAGVIADLSWEGAVASFSKLGLKNSDKILDKYHQNGIFQELEEGKITAEMFRVELSKMCNRNLLHEEIQKAWMGYFSGIDERKLEFLDILKQDYKIFLLSNTNPYVMSWACSESFSSKGRGLYEYFDKLYLSYEIGYTKPHEGIFNYLLNDARIKPEESMFIDDGLSNIETAIKLGMHTFQPKNATFWCDELERKLLFCKKEL